MKGSQLPDVSRLGALDHDVWRALGDRLHAIGLDTTSVGEVVRICDRLLEPLARPLRHYHLRKRNDVLSYGIRLFMLSDAVSRDEARAVLGTIPLEPLLAAGLLAGDEQIVCPFILSCMGPLYVLCDDLAHGRDAVMGVANTTAGLARAVGATEPLGRALDLGCGAGAVAMALAARARAVVATDINPRAIVFAQINTMLNAIDNVDVRVGDMFEPVSGETFDLIASQPPFVPKPEGYESTTYLYGGRRGDELALRLLRELPRHLAPGGRGVILVDWPVTGDSLDARVRDALQNDALSVLLLASPRNDLDEWSSVHAFLEERAVDERFMTRALQRREHFDRMGIEALRLTLNVIVDTGRDTGWTRTVDVLSPSRAVIYGHHIDTLIATSELLQRSDEQLLAARVRLPSGAEIVERGGSTRVVFAELLPPVDLTRGAAMLATAANDAPSVGAAIAQLSARLGDEMRAQMLAGIRQALALHVLEPVS